MSVRKLTASLLTALAMLGGAALVSAQDKFPVADPFAFDPDFNWFEPVYDMDLADMKPSKRAPTGWFATYDRLNLYGSRPELNEPQIPGGAGTTNADFKLDSGWGHRYEVGYMLPGEDNGWTFNWTKNDVSEHFAVRRERLNLFNDGQLPGGGTGDSAIGAFGFQARDGVRNNEGFSFRFVDIGRTQNVINYDSYELNKTWRMEPYHYGGILEPLVGLRWMRLHDLNSRDNFALVAPDAVGDPQGTIGEELTKVSAFTENEMFGGQVGFRYMKTRDRFTFTSDFKVFFGGNWQSSAVDRSVETIFYNNPTTVGDDPVFIRFDDDREAPVFARNEEFFVGFDLRGEVGYQLTKLLQVRVGAQMINIGRGVWRGGPGGAGIVGGEIPSGDNDQDYLQVGGTFGLALNH